MVRHASSGRPIAGVQVGIVNGPQTRSNARGEWELVGAPEGTRRLAARAVGFYPDRQTIDVVAEAAPVELSLATLRSVLDTVKVTARYAVYSVQREFMERARSGVGRYITAADIQRSNPLFITDMLRNVPGLWVDGIGGVGDVGIQMRGLFTSRCSPTIVMNGLPIPGLFAADIDGALYPEDIMGIEIYRAGLVPPQFLIGVNDVCGAIVIWRK
ncbi:MAG: TonB-dependent receptor plug domain-containing protein [Gemmatimonadaceae bacterium]